MPGPFDYTLNRPSPTQNLLGVLSAAQGLQQLKAQQAKTQQAQDYQVRLQGDLQSLGPNPSASALAKIMVKYPELSENFKKTYDVLSAEQQQSRIGEASQIYAAIESGDTDTAIGIAEEYATAYKNSGMERESTAMTALARLIKASPETARTSTGLFLASSMGPDKFTETFTKLQNERREADMAPEQLSKAQSDARKAAVAADFAESEAIMGLEKAGWDINKIQEDIAIAKENSRIAAMNAQYKREENQLKKEELKLKIDEAKQKRDTTVKERVADVNSAYSNIDNMLNTADRITQTPIGVIEDATGPIDSAMPTVDQDVADFEVLIENLDAQAFLAQVPNLKGLGALSDAEGKKVTAALQNFSLKQGPERLVANVREAQRLLLKARENISKRYGIPQSIPDTPDVQTQPDDIDALIQRYAPGVK